MFQLERDALLRKVAEITKQKIPRERKVVLTRQAVERAGIRHKPDIKRISLELLAEVGGHGNAKQEQQAAATRASREFLKKVAP